MTDLGSGPWYVIATAPGAHGVPGHAEAAQKPFPPGATILSGPYATRAEAEAAANKLLPKGTPGGGLSIPNPFSWVGAVAHWIGDFTLSITDVHMWISLGWLVLGLGLVYFGFLLWLKVPQTAVSVAEGAAARA